MARDHLSFLAWCLLFISPLGCTHQLVQTYQSGTSLAVLWKEPGKERSAKERASRR